MAGIDARGGVVDAVAGDTDAGLQGPQLLELLDPLEAAGRQVGVAEEDVAPVGIDAEVAQAAGLGGAAIAVPDGRGPGEPQGSMVGTQDDLHVVRIGLIEVVAIGREGGDAGIGVLIEQPGNEADVGRIDLGLVALDVDDDRSIEVGGDLGDASVPES